MACRLANHGCARFALCCSYLYSVVHRDELWEGLRFLGVQGDEVMESSERTLGHSHCASVPVQEQRFWLDHLRPRDEGK